jgi:hypothetical protein
MSELAELLERFRRGAEIVATSTTGAAGSELDFKPAEDQWSVRMILCHLADAEMVYGMRFRQVIAEDNPTLQAYDQNAWASNLNYSSHKVSQLLESFRRLRTDNFELLKDLPESTFARTGMHSENGKMTLLDLLRLQAGHAESHVKQLQRVRAAYKTSKTTTTPG